MSSGDAPLERAAQALRAALTAEHGALVALDADKLHTAGRDKLTALQDLTRAVDACAGALQRWESTLAELALQNRANGALLAARRRDVLWTLQQFGLVETQSAYDRSGDFGTAARARVQVSA